MTTPAEAPRTGRGLLDRLPVTAGMARELAVAEKVCVRPVMRTVTDRLTGAATTVPIACGSTRESRCPSCAHRARVLRMQQCAEGWHRSDEPEDEPAADLDPDDAAQLDDDEDSSDGDGDVQRRVRSTRRRQDAPDLPRLPMEARTVGRTFRAPSGAVYRPSMFVTLTLPSYGRVVPARASRSTRARTTTGGRRWTPSTSPSSSTGGCRTCAGAPGTGCSTSPRSNRSAGWRRTCTRRSVARSRG